MTRAVWNGCAHLLHTSLTVLNVPDHGQLAIWFEDSVYLLQGFMVGKPVGHYFFALLLSLIQAIMFKLTNEMPAKENVAQLVSKPLKVLGYSISPEQ
jgi:hypothetical protein